ncbi:MAG: cation transporter [Clostridiales bacterium]|nr:cation transporter [Clostridiales bacterium]
MTNLLTRIFIGKNKDDTNNPKIRGKYAALGCFTGIFLNVLLFAGKLTMGLLSHSVAIIADAFNNISDAGSSVVALIGFRLANKPVDKKHPLGHGRLEYVTGFIVDMLIILVGFELLTSSVDKIMHPQLPAVGTATLIILGAAILVKIWLFFFYRKIAKTINSTALKAASFDSLTDCIATTLVLTSAIVAKICGWQIDGYVGILVAVFIMFTGLKAAKETIDLLLGSTPDPEFVKQIYTFAQGYPLVLGIHDVMVHDYGPGRQIVSFHAEVDSEQDINIAHEEVDRMERDMHETFGCIVTIHLDPLVMNDPLLNELHQVAVTAAKEVNPDFSIHDFRMTMGETNVNLIFDLLLPADCKMETEEAENLVNEKIQRQKPNCFCVIRVERPFI